MSSKVSLMSGEESGDKLLWWGNKVTCSMLQTYSTLVWHKGEEYSLLKNRLRLD